MSVVIRGQQLRDREAGFVIAEVAQAHDGSLGTAHAFVDAVADAGADAIKFQTHIADAESTVDETFRVRFSRQDARRIDYWRRMEFTEEQWAGLAAHADERGLAFLSSAFSLEAVALLRRIGVAGWKVGSGEVRNTALLSAMTEAGGPILLSTGMSDWASIDASVAEVRRLGAPLLLFQCTSAYPTPLEDVGLNVLDEMRTRYAVPVGLSDHSGMPWPALAALARGAAAVEVHVTFHRKAFGPDVPASLTLEQLEMLVEARDAFAVMDANPVDKDAMAARLGGLRDLFGKSLALRADRPAGHVLSESDLTLKKPGTGIPADRLQSLIGRRLVQDVPAERLLREEDLAAADNRAGEGRL